MFTIGSLFDGSGGFPLAAFLCGGVPAWAAEIEPYPIAVTRTRFLHMKHLGSVTDVNGAEIEPVDLITFGSPCQDLSVAGKRAGLKHTENGDEETTRSGLFMEAVRIIREMREATNGVYPRFALWENVPGAFSSNKGEDFRIVLEELIKIVEPEAVMPPVPKNGWAYADHYCGDGWSLAYRTLDSQFWGVPQRRNRIYLVVDLRGQCAGEILFEREGLRGHFAEGRTPWESPAGDAESGVGTADRESERNCVAFSFDSLSSNSMKSSNPHSGCRQVEVARTLDCFDPSPAKNQGGIAVLEPVYCGNFLPQKKAEGMAWSTDETCCTLHNGACAGYQNAVVEEIPYLLKIRSGCEGGGKGPLIQEDMSATLSTLNDQYLFQPIAVATQQGGAEITKNGVCPTITAAAGMSGNNQPWVCYPDMVLDDQGGSQISVRDDGKCPTLRAEMHGNVPCVMESAGFKAGQSMAGGIGWQRETAATLSAECSGTEPTVCIKETLPFDTTQVTSPMNYSNPKWGDPSHPLAAGAHPPAVVCKCYDARGNGDGYITPTITGDHNNRVTDYTCVCCEPVPINDAATRYAGKRGDKQDGKSNGLCVGDSGDPMYTLTSGDRHSVCYANTYQKVTGPLMANSHPGSYCGQDAYSDMLVVGEKQGAYGVDCRNFTESPELYPTLQAKSNGGQSLNYSGAVRIQYIVRRLTPTECARLQGFPDGWGHPDSKTSFTDEDYEFWLNVRNTHAAINGKATKNYTREQMLTWYNKLHTDSSEYKMWGNGIALPTALYVMQGIADTFK